ncbi:hypothetical protein [Aeromonas sp. RU39B]|uniref:hypothetical protein n=1 Tax=Aeromonas sp. RU39B TaxID=1907416 RepID=UPI0011774538|nr:hypothetical protein [Aeromonas sp. RU39B]
MAKTAQTTQSIESGMTVIQSPGPTEGRSFIEFYTPKQRVFMGLNAVIRKIEGASDLNDIRPTLLNRLEKIASWESELCNVDPKENELEQHYPIPGAAYT